MLWVGRFGERKVGGIVVLMVWVELRGGIEEMMEVRW